MTNRERRILRGESIAPKTLDEQAIKNAVDNASPVYLPFAATISDDKTEVTTDVTLAQVLDALQTKRTVIAELSMEGLIAHLPFVGKNPADDPTAVIFGGVCDFTSVGAEEPTNIRLLITESGTTIFLTDLEVAT